MIKKFSFYAYLIKVNLNSNLNRFKNLENSFSAPI